MVGESASASPIAAPSEVASAHPASAQETVCRESPTIWPDLIAPYSACAICVGAGRNSNRVVAALTPTSHAAKSAIAVASAGRLSADPKRLSMDLMAERLIELMTQPKVFGLFLGHDLVPRPRQVDADALCDMGRAALQ